MSTERTRSQIGASNRRRGNQTQNEWAKAIRGWWPAAASNRNNGSASTADEGDITGTGPLIFWSIKYRDDIHQDGVLGAAMAEMRAKAGPGQLSVFVERRRGVRDPLRWYVHLWLDDFLTHLLEVQPHPGADQMAIRMLGRDLMIQLARRGLTEVVPPEPAQSDLIAEMMIDGESA